MRKRFQIHVSSRRYPFLKLAVGRIGWVNAADFDVDILLAVRRVLSFVCKWSLLGWMICLAPAGSFAGDEFSAWKGSIEYLIPSNTVAFSNSFVVITEDGITNDAYGNFWAHAGSNDLMVTVGGVKVHRNLKRFDPDNRKLFLTAGPYVGLTTTRLMRLYFANPSAQETNSVLPGLAWEKMRG